MSLRNLVAAGLALAAAGPAAARPLPAWSHSTTTLPDTVTPPARYVDDFKGRSDSFRRDGYGPDGVDGQFGFVLPAGRVLQGSQDRVLLAEVSAWLPIPPSVPVTSGRAGFDSPYTFYVNIWDDGSGQVGSVAISGRLGGFVSEESSALTNVFTGPASQSLVLGDTRYTVWGG